MIEVAKEAARISGNIILEHQGKTHKIIGKEIVGDFATEADIASEFEILRALKKAFPNHNFISEEVGVREMGSEYTWVIDPLDGTYAFSSGLPTYGVSIGLLHKGEPILGVINIPAQKSIYWAEKGKGAFLNGVSIRVSPQNKLEDVLLGLDVGYKGGREKELSDIAVPLSDKVLQIAMMCGAATACGYVAQGIYGAYVHKAKVWDYAAGAILIIEAGGNITDYQGKEIDWTQRDISLVASNGLVHEELLALLNKRS